MHKNNGSKIHQHIYTVFGNDNNTKIKETNQFNKMDEYGLDLIHCSQSNPGSA
jgi:hypothetical protein